MTHALFPISVNSDLFSSEDTVQALAVGLAGFDKITFLIADRIQIYNDITKTNGDIDAILSLDWSGSYRRDFEQRKRWLSKLRDRLRTKTQQRWRILGVDDAADHYAYVALRSVWLLYRFDNQFAADADKAAMDFAKRNGTDNGELLKDMSLGYLLEEIAINIRLRVLRGIFDEFYMGDTLQILPKLYQGCYSKSAEELMGRPARPKGSFRFWSWHDSKWLSWDAPKSGPHLRLVG